MLEIVGHSSGRGQLSTDLLAHLGFKRIVSCHFRDKRMRLKTRAYGIDPFTLQTIFYRSFRIHVSVAPSFRVHFCSSASLLLFRV